MMVCDCDLLTGVQTGWCDCQVKSSQVKSKFSLMMDH